MGLGTGTRSAAFGTLAISQFRAGALTPSPAQNTKPNIVMTRRYRVE
jgi:hypothetical protein